MSFATKIKEELIHLENLTTEEKKAELCAYIRYQGTVSMMSGKVYFFISTERLYLIRRVKTLLNEIYGLTSQTLIEEGKRLAKNKKFELYVYEGERVLKDLYIIPENGFPLMLPVHEDILNSKENRLLRSYLRGAFIANGSINDPTKKYSYHLEIYSSSKTLIDETYRFIRKFRLNVKQTVRNTQHLCYIKASEDIADFLKIIGSLQGLFHFEDVRITRDSKNYINRIMNAEIANEQRIQTSSMEHLDMIATYEAHIDPQEIPEKIRDVIALRKMYPDVSLSELAEYSDAQFTKSSINHQLRKIREYVKALEEEV